MAKNKNIIPAFPARILKIERAPYAEHPQFELTVPCVYGGGNQLRFVCPRCGVIHAHGSCAVGGQRGGTPSPHCYQGGGKENPNFLNGALDGYTFHWNLQELLEGDDLSLAGDLDPIADVICPRRKGEPGYDQLGRGSTAAYRFRRKLIAEYKKRGGDR